MAIDDHHTDTDTDTESCGSRAAAVDSSSSSSSSPTTSRNLHKLQVFNDILRRLQDSASPDTALPAFCHRLWLHFNRLPPRYALDVNVERAEDVLTHIRLLRQAQDDPLTTIAFDVRLVQVNPATNGHAGDSVHSYSSADDDNEGSVKNSLHLGLHAPPTFGSLQNLEAPGFQPNVEDRDSFVNNITSHSLRPMHEITFSTVDKPKLLNQLTSLLSEMSLNIQEAHAFSTVDGFSLDVFVVDGWPHEETELLRKLLDKEIRKIKPKEISSAAVGDHHHKSFKCSHKNVEGAVRRDNDVDIDQKLLKVGFKVASGSYGDLYRGTYCGEEVAIKILKPACLNGDVLKEFFQEVNIMRKIRHKNVVQFIGACTKPPNLFIVTEFIPKGNLYDFIHKRKGAFKFESLISAALDISTGMEYLHQNDIIHRDLKTANLLMDENGVIKVADFGVARVQTHSGVMTAETGTYRWMAPEVIGHKPYNHKADVFSFGILLWELLTGELPYSHLSPLQAAIGVVQKGLRPAIPKHTDPRLADLLERCWHQDPTLRPDFSEIIEILREIATEVEEERDRSPQVKSPDSSH